MTIYLRVLFASIGVQFCPEYGRRAEGQSAQQIVSSVDSRVSEGHEARALFAPRDERQRKGEHRELLARRAPARLLAPAHRRQSDHAGRQRGRFGQQVEKQNRHLDRQYRGRARRARSAVGFGGAGFARRQRGDQRGSARRRACSASSWPAPHSRAVLPRADSAVLFKFEFAARVFAPTATASVRARRWTRSSWWPNPAALDQGRRHHGLGGCGGARRGAGSRARSSGCYPSLESTRKSPGTS